MIKVLLLLLGILFVFSCSDKIDPIGKWDDNIKLSARNVVLKAEADSVIITTKGNWWWIDAISLEKNIFQYYNREDVNLESDSYSIKEENFVVERRDKNTLFIKMSGNNTGLERNMKISLQAGNYFDYINIKQAAD